MMMNLLLQCASTLALAAVSLAFIALFLLLAAGILLKATVHYTTGICSSTEQMHGKTVIITGGNSGWAFKCFLDLTLVHRLLGQFREPRWLYAATPG